MASVMLAAKPAQADCSKTTTVSVPYNWSVIRGGSQRADVSATNTGINTTVHGTGQNTFNASYTVNLNFTPLTNYCSQLTPTPTQNILGVTGYFGGYLATSYLNIPGITDTTWAQAKASVKVLPAFTEYNLKSATEFTIDESQAASVSVGVGSVVGVSGSVNTFATTGLGLPGFGGYSLASASLFVSANLTGQNSGTVNYAVAVPWETDSLPVIGSTVLFGLGLWGKSKLAQKQINKEEKNEDT
jgi:hypothetical protein